MWWSPLCLSGGRCIAPSTRDMIVVLHSVSERRCKVHSTLLLSSGGCVVHWNLFLRQRSGACSQCKGDEKTGSLEVVGYLANKRLMIVADNLSSWAIVNHHAFEWPCSTLTPQTRVVVVKQRALWVFIDCHVLEWPHITLVSQARVVVKLQRALWVIVNYHVLEWLHSTLTSQALVVVKLQRALWVIVGRHVLK